MTRHLLVVATLLCACEADREKLPIMPGGGGGGGVFRPDAAVDLDGGTEITGRACLLSDPRTPTTCAASGADGLLVQLGGQQATTGADGSFTIMRPTGATLVWSVTGAGVEPSAMRIASGATIPVLSSLLYGDMVAGMSAIVAVDTGAIIAHVSRNDAPLTGAQAIASPLPDSEIYYDGGGIADWDFDATGSFGVVWISSIAPGTASLTLDNGSVQASVGGIPVIAGAITFELAEIP